MSSNKNIFKQHGFSKSPYSNITVNYLSDIHSGMPTPDGIPRKVFTPECP